METNKNGSDLQALAEDTTLNYKEHHLFFEDYYLSKKEFIKSISECHADISLIPEAYTKLNAFIITVIAQIQIKKQFKEINDKKNALFESVNKKKNPLIVINDMTLLFSEVCQICMELELEPKPIIKEDPEEVKFWKDEEHQGLREIKKAFQDILSIKNG